MALVAYDASSESETEEVEESNSKIILNGSSRFASTNSNNTITNNPEESENAPLFTNLPQPKTNKFQATVKEENDEFLKKKEQPIEKPRKIKQPVKIGISAITDFNSDDDDDEPKNKRLNLDKSSGLFALLPPPKGAKLTNTSFVPNVLQKKVITTTATKKPNKLGMVPPKEVVNTTDKSTDDDNDEDDDVEIPETFDDEMWQKICGRQKRPVKPAVQEELPTVYEAPTQAVELAPEVEKPYAGLDNEAFKELVGNSKKRKVNIELIDIHEDEIRPDREEWLKSLTDPNCEPQTEPENPVNNTCRAKNHITSLAQKALANDKELQMRWAESRHNRRQTQAKYGF